MTDPQPWDDARIREAFIYDGGEAAYHDPIHGEQTQREIAGKIFDTWLAEHDARIRVERGALIHYALLDGIPYTWSHPFDGVAYALDGANAGHWVEFGGKGIEIVEFDDLIQRGYRLTKPENDPLPWVVHSIDMGDQRFATEAQCWVGYRANFEPRPKYNQSREAY